MPRHLATLAAALFGAIVVVDGDTVDYGRQQLPPARLRHARDLLGQVRQRGHAATVRLKQLIETRDARLKPTGRDCRYNRECAYLYVDGEDVAAVMIRDGHARPYNGGQREGWWGS